LGEENEIILNLQLWKKLQIAALGKQPICENLRPVNETFWRVAVGEGPRYVHHLQDNCTWWMGKL